MTKDIIYNGTIIGTLTDGHFVSNDKIQEIPEGALRGNAEIESVEISYGTTRIGAHAFEGCTSLKEVRISNSWTKIFEYAFAGCTSLAAALIEENVTVADTAFDDLDNLISLGVMGTPNYYYTYGKGEGKTLEIRGVGKFHSVDCTFKTYREIVEIASGWVFNETYPDNNDHCGSDYEFCYDGESTSTYKLMPDNCLFKNGELIGVINWDVAVMIAEPRKHRAISYNGGEFRLPREKHYYELFHR